MRRTKGEYGKLPLGAVKPVDELQVELETIGGEPLEGSGFEDETPDAPEVPGAVESSE
jgi:hypothetical protein